MGGWRKERRQSKKKWMEGKRKRKEDIRRGSALQKFCHANIMSLSFPIFNINIVDMVTFPSLTHRPSQKH